MTTLSLQGIKIEAPKKPEIALQASAVKHLGPVDTGRDGKILAELTAHCQTKKLDNPLGPFELTPEEVPARIVRLNALKAAIYEDRNISNSNRNVLVNYLSEYTQELKCILGRAAAFGFSNRRQARAAEARRLSAASVAPAKPKKISASKLGTMLFKGRARARMSAQEAVSNLPITADDLLRIEGGEIIELPMAILLAFFT